MDTPLDDLLHAVSTLQNVGDGAATGHARPDLNRESRKGVPEVIYAGPKTPEQVLRIAASFVEARGRAIVSRATPEVQALLRERFADQLVEVSEISGMVVVRRPGQEVRRTGGKVAVITAGTSDLPVSEQAVIVAREMGCDVLTVTDVGVAGLHRLIAPLNEVLSAGVDVIVVAAGMDGALPSVVSGIVDVPVIGLPTSTGYGMGGNGVAALLSMLQTCAPGLTVVNIDNGVGAGATAGLIANRAAMARKSGTERR